MTEEHRAPDEVGAKKEFSIVRKGYDPAEVEHYLAEYDQAFRDLEEYATRLKHELTEARHQISRLETAEQDSIDNAMLAVFDAKDRIIQGAMEKARQIEEQARVGAGLPPAEPVAAPSEDEVVTAEDPIGRELLAELTEVVGDDDAGSGVDPNEVLQQMLEEAEQIRTRLDSGLAAAFDQMEKMQRDAETRAEDMLAAARLEAARLRASGQSPKEPSIEVTLTDDEERPSRYSRNSAGLPRIGGDDGSSVLAKMNSLRARLREDDDNDPEPIPTQDATG